MHRHEVNRTLISYTIHVVPYFATADSPIVARPASSA